MQEPSDARVQAPEPAEGGQAREVRMEQLQGESKSASMKRRICTRYSRSSHARSRTYPAASRAPAKRSISASIASAPVCTSRVLPSANRAR